MENTDRELFEDIFEELKSIRARLSFLAYLAGLGTFVYVVAALYRWLVN